MFRRLLLIVTIVSLIAPPAHAQLAVIDPANLVQTTLIAYRMQQHYAELRAEYLTVLRMAQGLGNMDRYRIPDDPHHGARPEPLGLRQIVDSGSQQRRCHAALRISRQPCRCSGRPAFPRTSLRQPDRRWSVSTPRSKSQTRWR